MQLVIDIGNSFTKIGQFTDEGTLLKMERMAMADATSLPKWVLDETYKKIGVSTVRKIPSAWQSSLTNLSSSILLLDEDTPLPIRNSYETPETLGRDRLAAAVGAWACRPGEHAVIVDAGTCITIDFLHKDGDFMGGNISPGIGMRLQAMHAFTHALPLVQTGEMKSAIGSSTEMAIRNGAQFGAVWEVAGFVSQAEHTYGKVNLFITGGDAHFFENIQKNNTFARANLVLEGLHQILRYATTL